MRDPESSQRQATRSVRYGCLPAVEPAGAIFARIQQFSRMATLYEKLGALVKGDDVEGDGNAPKNVDFQSMIKALLKRYKYPPDQEVSAVDLVLQQTEMISEE